ncbi:hypothetical protein QP968_00570 [Corynebacterium sp. MSK041]|nr:hypothetical protein [Corynebacterium sp. MSK041]MDK8794206.1 hypothetical protein [Corynebacterium sp. MSK041]
MTPEQIHELLDNATPGPWEARATYANGTPMTRQPPLPSTTN